MAPVVRRRTALLLVAGVLSVGAVACSADYTYVNNSAENTFFRVPADVKVFRIRTEQPTDRPAPIQTSTNDTWNVVFDAASEPSPDHSDEAAPADVVGSATIIPVDYDVSEGLSVAQVRAVLAGGTDPLTAEETSGVGAIEIVSFETLNENGVPGSRVVFNKQVADGVWTTYDQTSLVDVVGRKVYFFEVKCESTCFKDERDQISQIVDSWQVRK